MVTDGSFLAIGVALWLLAVGILLVWGLEQARLRLGQRGVHFAPVPESLSFLLLGALTATLLQLGFLSEWLGAVVSELDDSFGTLVLTMLLPPIVMHSALDLGRGAGAVELEVLARYFFPGCVYAGLGTLISAALIGVVMFLAGLAGASTPLSGAAALLLGSCTSASDTVAVIDIFERLNPGAEAYALTYIESMFNDAVSIVLFHALAPFAGGGGDSGGAATAAAAASFFGVFLGSLLLGGAVGGSAVLLFRNFRSAPPPAAASPLESGGGGAAAAAAAPFAFPPPRGSAPPSPLRPAPGAARAAVAGGAPLEPAHPHLLTAAEQVEVALLLLTGFVAYMVAEGLRASGVVACLACGVLLGRFALPLVGAASRSFTLGVLKLLASLCDKMVYLGLGIALPTLSSLGAHWRPALWLLFAVLGARAAAVAGSAAAVGAAARWAAARRRGAAGGGRRFCGALLSRLSRSDNDAQDSERAPVMATEEAAGGGGAHGGGGALTFAPTSPRAALVVGWAGSLRGGVAFALAATGQAVLERGGNAEGGRMLPVASLFVVLVTLFGVTLSLPRLILAQGGGPDDAAGAEEREIGAGDGKKDGADAASGATATFSGAAALAAISQAPPPPLQSSPPQSSLLPPPQSSLPPLQSSLPLAVQGQSPPQQPLPPPPPVPPRGRGSPHAAAVATAVGGVGGRARAQAAAVATAFKNTLARGFSVPPSSR